MSPFENNPMDHPDEQPATSADESPRFGRLLLVLLGAVATITLLTFVMASLYT